MAKLTFLGTGTSQGVPVIGCGCWVCKSTDPRDKRLRTSAMIETQGRRIIIDAGPDFRYQMLRENVEAIDGIMLTHEHKDHTAGIDDVRAFNYVMRKPVDIFATSHVQQTIRKDFDYAFKLEDKYPGAPEINLLTIDPDRPFEVAGIEVTPIKGNHYEIPVLGFLVDGIAYLTDFNHISDQEIEKIKNVDILVINALRHEHHLSHFSLPEALHIRHLVQPQKCYLTHVSHQMGRYAQISKELPSETYFAYDGMCVHT